MTVNSKISDLIQDHAGEEANQLLQRIEGLDEDLLVLGLKHTILVDLPRHMLKATGYTAEEAGLTLDKARGVNIDEADQKISEALNELAQTLRYREDSELIDELVDYWDEQRVILDAFAEDTGLVSSQLQTHQAIEELMKRTSKHPGMVGWLNWAQVFEDYATRIAGKPEEPKVKFEQMIDGEWRDVMEPKPDAQEPLVDRIPSYEDCTEYLGDREKALLDTMVEDLKSHQGDASAKQTAVDQWFEDYVAAGGINCEAMLFSFIHRQHEAAGTDGSSLIIKPALPVQRQTDADKVKSWLNVDELGHVDEIIELTKRMNDRHASDEARCLISLKEELSQKEGINTRLLWAAANWIETMHEQESIIVRHEQDADWLGFTEFPDLRDDMVNPWSFKHYYEVSGMPVRPDGTAIDIDSYGADISEAVSATELGDGGVEMTIHWMGGYRMISGWAFLWTEQEHQHMYPLLIASQPEGYSCNEVLINGQKHYVASVWDQD